MRKGVVHQQILRLTSWSGQWAQSSILCIHGQEIPLACVAMDEGSRTRSIVIAALAFRIKTVFIETKHNISEQMNLKATWPVSIILVGIVGVRTMRLVRHNLDRSGPSEYVEDRMTFAAQEANQVNSWSRLDRPDQSCYSQSLAGS